MNERTSTIFPVSVIAFDMSLTLMLPTVLILWLQAAPDWVSQADKITLTGAAFLALWIMGRAYQAKDLAKDTAVAAKDVVIAAKDNMLVETMKSVTQALTLSSTTNAELRQVIQASIEAKNNLANELSDDTARIKLEIELLRAALAQLPCTSPGLAKVIAGSDDKEARSGARGERGANFK